MIKSSKRRKHSDKFKAKVALEAIRGVKTLAQLAAEHKVHPNQISTWKRQLLENAEDIFSSGKKAKGQEEITAPLFEEIGRLKMDIKWFEKKLQACRLSCAASGSNRIGSIPSGGNASWQAFPVRDFTTSLQPNPMKIWP
eukprot:TRINITY_DN27260_c0_g1_i1.p2 TRINITY_DN27260_c0_g1~~TRINITY_DN27260_c0_g1_i1.p2  ORF type:complete len:140 (-),score=16.27 TRINITY_DN27260_c0_g1_i1:239-658(-)